VLVHPQSELIREPRLLVPGQQPLGRVVVNRSHPLANALSLAFVAISTLPQMSVINNRTFSAVNDHVYYATRASGSYLKGSSQGFVSSLYSVPAVRTIVCRILFGAEPGSEVILNPGTSGSACWCGAQSSGRITIGGSVNSANNAIVPGKEQIVGFTTNGTSHSIYVDGVIATGTANLASGTGCRLFAFDTRATGYILINGGISGLYVFDRVFSQAEFDALAADFFCLVSPA
jgi:hypothetical protein